MTLVAFPARVRAAADSARRDPRYGSKRWRKVRLAVLNRDMWTCLIVAGCTTRASVADHILPVYPGMPDALFFSMGNLRSGCRAHNLARAAADSLVPATAAPGESSDVVTSDYSRRTG